MALLTRSLLISFTFDNWDLHRMTFLNVSNNSKCYKLNVFGQARKTVVEMKQESKTYLHYILLNFNVINS